MALKGRHGDIRRRTAPKVKLNLTKSNNLQSATKMSTTPPISKKSQASRHGLLSDADFKGSLDHLSITNLSSSVVILSHLAPYLSVSINDVENVVFSFKGQINGPLLAKNCKNCAIAVSCQQFRLHSATDVRIFLEGTSEPIIEHSTAVQFSPTSLKVRDFSWPNNFSNPNWSFGDTADLRRVDEDATNQGVDALLTKYLPVAR